jgi:hypothetical protein
LNILKFPLRSIFFLFFQRRIEYDLKSPTSATHNPIVNIRSPELHHKQGRADSISSDLSNLTIDSDGIISPKNQNFIYLLYVNIYLREF